MEFFEKLGKKASETYKTAAEKTNKIAGDTKLKVKIHDNKSKIDDLYMEIGKKIYKEYKHNENMEIKDYIKTELENIDKLTGEIAKYESERLDLSDMVECPECKNGVDKEAKFCPICGAELQKDEDATKVAENNEEEEKPKEDEGTEN